MMSKDYNLQFKKLCHKINVGNLLSEPDQVFGGHLNRMYALKTTTGQYAVKALNPQIMLRPEAMQNYMNSEQISQIAAKHIPAAPAKSFDGEFMQEIDGQFYLVFDWIEGKSLFENEITVIHCRKIGEILAKLHSIDFSDLGLVDTYYADEQFVDWDEYLIKGREINAAWAELIGENLAYLKEWNLRLLNAADALSSNVVISHGDLEPKNVIWRNNNPILIDWEAAGFINPMHDLVETAMYWSKEDGTTNKDKFIAFVDSYKKAYSNRIDADWSLVLDKGLGSKLGWLEYSLKRSLGIESTSEAEQQMGTEHVIGSLRILHDYVHMKDQIIDWIRTIA